MIHGMLLARVSGLDVEDLVQDVFLAAWRRLDNLRDPAAFGGWVAMIARNRATDFHRSSIEAVELPDTLEAHDATAAGPEASAVLETIRQLPEAYRETLILRLVEGMTGPDIAIAQMRAQRHDRSPQGAGIPVRRAAVVAEKQGGQHVLRHSKGRGGA